MKYKDKKNFSNFDVIVVLGAAVWNGGLPSPALKRRLLHAVSLFKKGKANYLLVTGGLGKYPPTEASVMKELALKQGLNSENILVEDKGKSTFQSVLESIRIIREHNWTNAIVVSDPYHLFRALLVFRCFNIRVIGSAAKGGKEANKLWKWSYYYLREYIALPWYIVLIIILKLKKF